MKAAFTALLLLGAQVFAQHKVPPTASIAITGDVKKELKLDAAAIAAFQIHEVGDYVQRNHRGEIKRTMHGMKGVLLTDIIDSAGISYDKPKELSGTVIMLRASDDYCSAFSWNELYNSNTGKHVFVVTECDGKKIGEMEGAIVVVSTADGDNGSRYMRGTAKVIISRPAK
jgi:hypothetical protein